MLLAAARQQIADRLAAGDPDGALALAAQVRQLFPNDYHLAYLSGRAMLLEGDAAAARSELERAAHAAPDDRDIWVELERCGGEGAGLLLAELPPL
ncbi:MAG TPA: tetratricopeptide repeat protein, partial [Chloroflexota bacterium]|nr:tetratricopeptide repeat protein [Chloroflexota bacterium]